jgi:hypothetical protein
VRGEIQKPARGEEIMSSITVTTEVTSDSSNQTLDVKDHGAPISVPHEADATNLIWQLTGTAAQGSFNAIDLTDPNSGFYWIDTPPTGVFSTPVLSANGNQITMTDTNNASPGGPWRYKLNATIQNVHYSTTSSTPKETTNNPQIKNN